MKTGNVDDGTHCSSHSGACVGGVCVDMPDYSASISTPAPPTPAPSTPAPSTPAPPTPAPPTPAPQTVAPASGNDNDNDNLKARCVCEREREYCTYIVAEYNILGICIRCSVLALET